MGRKLLFSVSLKDCKMEFLRSSKGAGGQHRDKTSSAVRITHEPSGAVGFSQEYREQPRNKKLAFTRMAQTQEFKTWVRMRAMDLQPIEDVIEEQMRPENVRIEGKVGGKWTPMAMTNGSVA